MIKTFGLTHTALPVADIDRSLRFYQSLLGAEVRSRGNDTAEFGTPDCHDVVTLTRARDGRTGDMGQLGHLGFRLRRQEEPYVYAKDPDGYTIELWYEP